MRPLKRDSREIGLNILLARRRADIGQDELARRSGFSVHLISRWERGVNRPKPGRLSVLARVLGIRLEDLLPGQADPAEGGAA